uniref:Ankyrin repeat protein n=1 Tax=Macrostomum lignano TaxID=282301 RepID=A0A1I8J0J3_9PLAT
MLASPPIVDEDVITVPSALLSGEDLDPPPANTPLLPDREEFNTHLINHYPPTSRSIGGEIRQEFADRIISFLKDPRTEQDSAFRLFVRKKQFRILQVPSAGGGMREILVCSRKEGDSNVFKRVATDLPTTVVRSVIELFLKLCPVCAKRLQSYRIFTNSLKEEGLYNKHRQSALKAIEQREQAYLTSISEDACIGSDPISQAGLSDFPVLGGASVLASVTSGSAGTPTKPTLTCLPLPTGVRTSSSGASAAAADSAALAAAVDTPALSMETLRNLSVTHLYPTDVLQQLCGPQHELVLNLEEDVLKTSNPTAVSATHWTVSGGQIAVSVFGYNPKIDGVLYVGSYPLIAETDIVSFIRLIPGLESAMGMPMTLSLTEEELQAMSYVEYQQDNILVVPCFVSALSFSVNRSLREYAPFVGEKVQQFLLSGVPEPEKAFQPGLTQQFCRLSVYMGQMNVHGALNTQELVIVHHYLQLVTSYTQELTQLGSSHDFLPLASTISLLKDLENLLASSPYSEQPLFRLLTDTLLVSLRDIYLKNRRLRTLLSLCAVLHPKFKDSGERHYDQAEVDELIEYLCQQNHLAFCETRQVLIDDQCMTVLVKRPVAEIYAKVKEQLNRALITYREQVCSWRTFWEHKSTTIPHLWRFLQHLLVLPVTAAPPSKLLTTKFQRRLSALQPEQLHAQLRLHFNSKPYGVLPAQ